MRNKDMRRILANANILAKRLLRNKITLPINIPVARGVYLIKNKRGETIYVGKAKNLHTRINNDHLGKNIEKTTFQRALKKTKKLKKPHKWIARNCRFVYVMVSDSNMCGLVETLVIVLLRPYGKLLNSAK